MFESALIGKLLRTNWKFMLLMYLKKMFNLPAPRRGCISVDPLKWRKAHQSKLIFLEVYNLSMYSMIGSEALMYLRICFSADSSETMLNSRTHTINRVSNIQNRNLKHTNLMSIIWTETVCSHLYIVYTQQPDSLQQHYFKFYAIASEKGLHLTMRKITSNQTKFRPVF